MCFCWLFRVLCCLPAGPLPSAAKWPGYPLLPPDSRVVADRLAGLRELPAGAWKMHVGDVAHGEDVNLDDSSWQTVAMGEKAPNEAVWFRQTIQVPETLNGYDLTGARIWLVQCERQRTHAGDFLFQWQARCAGRGS